MAFTDLGNGVMFDPITGALKIGDQYNYDPSKGTTSFGGNSYTGRYDPAVLSLITPELQQQAKDKYDPLFDEQFEKEAFDRTATMGGYYNQDTKVGGDQGLFDKVLGEVGKKYTDRFNRYEMSEAYSQAAKGYEGPNTFDTLMQKYEQMAPGAGKIVGDKSTDVVTKQALLENAQNYMSEEDGLKNVLNNPNLPDSVKQSILADFKVKNPGTTTPQFTPQQASNQSTASSNPILTPPSQQNQQTPQVSAQEQAYDSVLPQDTNAFENSQLYGEIQGLVGDARQLIGSKASGKVGNPGASQATPAYNMGSSEMSIAPQAELPQTLNPVNGTSFSSDQSSNSYSGKGGNSSVGSTFKLS